MTPRLFVCGAVCLLACGGSAQPVEGVGGAQTLGACETMGEVVTRESTALGDTALLRWSGGRSHIALVLVFHHYARVRAEIELALIDAEEDVCIPGHRVGGFVGFESSGGIYNDMWRFVRVGVSDVTTGDRSRREPHTITFTLVLESESDPSLHRTIIIPHVTAPVEEPPMPASSGPTRL